MLRLLQCEILKLRRRKITLVMFTALLMPILMFFYVKYLKMTSVEPALFFRWSSFGFTFGFLLPIILGVLCTISIHNDVQYGMLKQIWIVPVSKVQYFFSKFFLVLLFSVLFMLISAFGTLIAGVLSGSVEITFRSVLYLLQKCLEIGILTPFAMLPILAIAYCQKGYILPMCLTLVYVFANFIIVNTNMYVHPISCVSVIILRNNDVPGMDLSQAIHVPMAFLSIAIWGGLSVGIASLTRKRR